MFGIDARTGKLKWTWSPIPKELQDKTGTANVWASMSVDPQAGIVYLPVSSPSPNYYGGDRLTEMPFVTSTTALNAETGEVVWSRQLIHHDIWDLDINSAPHPGRHQEGRAGDSGPGAVDQAGLSCSCSTAAPASRSIRSRNGRCPPPTFRAKRRRPPSPYVPLPAPTIPDKMPGVFALADIASFGDCSKWAARLRDEGRFTPPSIRGSIAYPATVGGG